MMWFKDVIRLLVISLMLTTWACDPVEVPEPKEEDPSFWSEIEFEDTGYEWASGKSSVYNFSDYEAVRGDGIRFSSILQPDSCNYPCPSSFRVDLFGPERWKPGQTVNPNTQFRPVVRDWFRENEMVSGYTLNGSLMPVDSPNTIIKRVVWSLNGEVVATNKEEFTDVVIDTMKPHNLCVKLTGEDGFEQQICHYSQKIHAKSQPLSVKLKGKKSANGRATILMAEVNFGVRPYTYFWNGEMTNSQVHEFVNKHDTMSVKLEVVDSEGTRVTFQNIIHTVDEKVFPINVGMLVRTKRSEVLSPVFNKASIRWVDREGNEFSTAFGVQPNWASFKVESFEPFRSGATGDHMAKVGLAFKGVLYSRDNRRREARSGRATMLFRYPN